MNDLSIIITKTGEFAVVDALLFGSLNRHPWHRRTDGYFCSGLGKKGSHAYLHRMVFSPALGSITDHKNGDKRDNTFRNLRSATRCQSMFNITKQKRKVVGSGYSKYKGVQQVVQRHGITSKWRAKICKNHVVSDLGVFDSERLAAQAYNDAAVKLFGEYAKLNVIT